MEKFTEYGLRNVASNFAYDTDQEFFRKPIAIHGGAFMMGVSVRRSRMGLWGRIMVNLYLVLLGKDSEEVL